MIPEPTPVSGMPVPKPLSVCDEDVIWTTAGPTLSATAVTAELSSSVSGWRDPAFVPGARVDAGVIDAGRSRTPLASRAANVAPEARSADTRQADRIVGRPTPDRARSSGRTGSADRTGAEGSNQRSGVGADGLQLGPLHGFGDDGGGE